MSNDSDPQQRLWLSLGYGQKRGSKSTWRYWETGPKRWIICAPNALAEFVQVDRNVFYKDKQIVEEARNQWAATWAALAYFYSDVIQTLPPTPKSGKRDA